MIIFSIFEKMFSNIDGLICALINQTIYYSSIHQKNSIFIFLSCTDPHRSAMSCRNSLENRSFRDGGSNRCSKNFRENRSSNSSMKKLKGGLTIYWSKLIIFWWSWNIDMVICLLYRWAKCFNEIIMN